MHAPSGAGLGSVNARPGYQHIPSPGDDTWRRALKPLSNGAAWTPSDFLAACACTPSPPARPFYCLLSQASYIYAEDRNSVIGISVKLEEGGAQANCWMRQQKVTISGNSSGRARVLHLIESFTMPMHGGTRARRRSRGAGGVAPPDPQSAISLATGSSDGGGSWA